ncbi:MAG: L-threonylcarbamoyladenylate synthase [Bacteroidota bacterium]
MGNIISQDIEQAVALLTAGELVAIPTETVYGLAGNIFNPSAIRKIFAMKQRPLFNPLIVHIHSFDQLDEFVLYLPEKARWLAEAFWPGPLTLILPKKPLIPDLITADKPTVAVRMPNHPLMLALLRKLPFPLAAPSANPSGGISPTKAEHVANYFSDTLKMVLDGGDCTQGIESTIIGFDGDQPVVYRLGSLSMEAIKAVVGDLPLRNKKEQTPDAPGMLSRHYAPDTKTYLVDDVAAFISGKDNQKIGVLLFQHPLNQASLSAEIILSPEGDLAEATAKLYASLHQLDAMDLDLIVAERFPDQGLGKSINDRLERATKEK